MKPGLDKIRWAVAALVVAVFGVVYRGTLVYSAEMFNDPKEDLLHGWLVPLVSACMVWELRARLRQAAGAPSGRGLLWMGVLLGVYWFGSRGQQERLEQLSLIGMVWAFPYALWGRRVGDLLRLPALYLLFIIPLASYLDFFTIHLRILASSLSVALLNGFGLEVEQSGTALISHAAGAEFNVDVASPCSGIRSLFAMMALSAAYAHFTQRTTFQKWALFLFSIPLAVAGNIFRVLSICLVARFFGQAVAVGFYHDYSGYVVFLTGVALLVELGRLLSRLDGRLGQWSFLPEGLRRAGPPPACPAPSSAASGPRAAYAVLALALLLPVGMTFVKSRMAAPVFGGVDFVAKALPAQLDGFTSDVPWFCHNEQCLRAANERDLIAKGSRNDGAFACPACGERMYPISRGEKTILPSDTAISKREYRGQDGLSYVVTMVVAGRRRGSIHRPELCLPAQGFAMTEARKVELGLADGFPKRVRAITVQRASGSPFTLVYWFFCRDRQSCSHTERILSDVWDRSVHNRINRWVMVAVNVSAPLDTPEAVGQFKSFLSELYPKLKLTQ